MLEKKLRVNARFPLHNPKAISTPLFTMLVAPNSFGYSRIGVIVSKKVDKKAVIRNRIRRVIHTLAQQYYENIKPGFDILFVTKKTIVQQSKETTGYSIEQALKKI